MILHKSLTLKDSDSHMKRLKWTNCWQLMDKYITPLSGPTWKENFKGILLASRKLLTTKSPLKMMKNTFYFLVKTLFGLEKFIVLSWLFGHVEKQLDEKAMINYKIYNVTDWTENDYNTHITQYFEKYRQLGN